MEKKLRHATIARGLAAALLAGVLVLAWLEHRSDFAQGLRTGRPVLAWLVLTPAACGDGAACGTALFLAVYQPVRRSLDLVYIPGAARTAPQDRIQAAAGSLSLLVPAWKDWAGLPVWRGTCPPLSDEPPLDARSWVLAHARAGRSPLTGAGGASWGPFDRLLLALEVERLRPAAVRPAWLPPPAQVGPLLSRCLSPDPGDRPTAGRVTVEVLNASSQPGIANRAKNILRLGGADVMSVGNASGPRARTLVYDRIGRFDGAAQVARLLGCPAAQALTQVDRKRLVDVTVVLAEDCPLPQ